MTAAALLAELEAAGIHLTREGDNLRVRAAMLANMTNASRRRNRLRNVPQQPESSMRSTILKALEESLAGAKKTGRR